MAEEGVTSMVIVSKHLDLDQNLGCLPSFSTPWKDGKHPKLKPNQGVFALNLDEYPLEKPNMDPQCQCFVEENQSDSGSRSTRRLRFRGVN